jgi:hypothetical protein
MGVVETFTEQEHRDALLSRRIKFVVEKDAMARDNACGGR